jgi:hypothetical protein
VSLRRRPPVSIASRASASCGKARVGLSALSAQSVSYVLSTGETCQCNFSWIWFREWSSFLQSQKSQRTRPGAAGSSHSAESRDLSRQKGVTSRTREKSAAVSPSAPGFLRSSREGSAARTRTPTLSRLSVGHGSGLTREDFVNSVWKYQSGDCSWLSVGAR